MSELGLGSMLERGETPRWLEEIKTSIPILEILDEKFYGISHLMAREAVIYGGSVIAVLLGDKILGDIDIAVSQEEAKKQLFYFSQSAKWIATGDQLSRSGKYGSDTSFAERINQIITFQTFDSVMAQVIVANNSEDDFTNFDSALRVVRKVDFSACAIAVNSMGQVFETIRGAYDDCMSRTLRIIRPKDEINIYGIRDRVEKYKSRGFKLTEESEKLLEETATRKKQEPLSDKARYLCDALGPLSTVRRIDATTICVEVDRKLFTRLEIGKNTLHKLLEGLSQGLKVHLHAMTEKNTIVLKKEEMDRFIFGLLPSPQDLDIVLKAWERTKKDIMKTYSQNPSKYFVD
jgi:hypothetical protein